MEKEKTPLYYYYQCRFDTHDILDLTEPLDYLELNPYEYVCGLEYKKDGTPHYQCILALKTLLSQNDKTKLRTKIQKKLKDKNITHKNAVSVTTAKSPYDLLEYCTKEGKFISTFTKECETFALSFGKQKSKQDFKRSRDEYIKVNLKQYQNSPISTFYGSIIKFHLENNKCPPSRSYLRFLALQYKLYSVEHYLQLIGLDMD